MFTSWYVDCTTNSVMVCYCSALEKRAQSIEEQCAKEKVSEIICLTF